MLGISPKNLDVLLKYLGGLHSHLRRQVMLFKPRTIDEALCASTISRDGQEERTTKWFQVERPPRHFQGGKEEVERKG
jgi:hypothetical protein